ncbi:MAG: NAD(P)-binding domain-containing protein [Alphaproteobacteria bacterium]|nr:NAD(P)-binding domain-containing protein [Alphaproteobacteria bacterium]
MTFERYGIVGGGAWGTALAQTLATSGRQVVLWAREAETVTSINARHENELFLPGVALHKDLRATGDFADLTACDAILMVAPAQHVRSVTTQLYAHLNSTTPIVLCAKGIEQATGKQMIEV